MKQKRARLIYNPTSGQEIMKKNVAEVLDILEGAGFEASAFQTTPDENSAKNEATRAAKAGFDLLLQVEMEQSMRLFLGLPHSKSAHKWRLFQRGQQMTLHAL
jgi:hypothetical protein